MKKIFSALVLTATLVLLFFSSCATEEPAVEKQTGSLNVNRAADYFNNNPIALKNNFYFLGKPDWKKAVYVQDTLTVPFITERPIFVKNGARKNNSGYFLRSYLVVTPKNAGSNFDYKLKVTFSPKTNEAAVKWYHIYNQANVLISENGKRPIKKRRIKSETALDACPYRIVSFDVSLAEQQRIFDEWWECVMRYHDNEEEEVLPPDGGNEEEDQTDAEIIEEIIVDRELDPCPKAVLAQLKNATNCDISNILTKLGTNSVYNVTITSGDAGTVPAITSRIRENNYKITLSKDRFTSATQLFKASILLHELGHAFFMSLVEDFDASKNLVVFSEFPLLFQAFVDKKYHGSTEDFQHAEMANTYVEAIGAALQEFQTGVAVPYGTKPTEIYTDLAWGGLRDAPIFSKKFPKGTTERLRIENRLASEQTGNPVGSGTPLEQKPVGKPCK
ncbi:hypothetical protein [Flavobacterium poyangense]|uniref:hypothetical protein n=1 Tax=Flavobacterium poyangense TaxID=2204302 RepID=UPI00141E6782|nr:hypothetical protein [Flavobacterium sp. JXAS1]